MGETVVVINSFLMTTPICLTLDDFSEFLKLPPDGESNEKGLSNPILVVPSSNASKLNLQDHFLHLILTWILRSISKHAITRSINYWWIEIFQTNRHPDLALIMFDDIPKVTGKEFTSFITFLFGTYLSYIFKHLNIPTQGDPPLATLTPLSFGMLRHVGYKKDPRI
ncbi:hypothetical protein Golob_013414, partial [Gossypium lobatum]|nr:hypothetical protein [Gossypium lobatum]